MSPRIRTMVVGVDSVRAEDPVLKPAIDLAERLDATLHVVHGFMLTDPLLDAYARAGYLAETTISNFGQELQVALETQVAALTTSSKVHARAIGGPPAAALLDLACEVEADLVIVGPTRHGTFPRSLLGNTCRSVLRSSAVPVLTLRPGVPTFPHRLLVATDLSPLSAAALDFGLTLAASAGRAVPDIRTLLVIDDSLLLLPLEQRLLDRVAKAELEEFVQGAAAGAMDVQRTVRKGDPPTEILDEARDWGAELIVLGTHGRKGMERLFLGSVAEEAVRGAACNVLVVPATSTPEGDSGAQSAAVRRSAELPYLPPPV